MRPWVRAWLSVSQDHSWADLAIQLDLQICLPGHGLTLRVILSYTVNCGSVWASPPKSPNIATLLLGSKTLLLRATDEGQEPQWALHSGHSSPHGCPSFRSQQPPRLSVP